MSAQENHDFRSTRQELSFELEPAPYDFPNDFDLRIIQDFCDNYRARETVGFSNEELLIDRRLLRNENGKPRPVNGLVMLGKEPRKIHTWLSIAHPKVEGQGQCYTPQRDRTVEGNMLREGAEIISGLIYDVTWLRDPANSLPRQSTLSMLGSRPS